MSTAGEILVSLSGLSGVSAGTHLLAITTGTGTGETVFASRFSVQIQEPLVTIFRKAKRRAPEESTRPAVRRSAENPGKYAYAFTATKRLSLLTQSDSLYVQHTTMNAVVTQQFDRQSIIKKRN